MNALVINPGAGPVSGSTLDHAYANMERLLADAGMKGGEFHRDCDPDNESDDGRFVFLVNIGDEKVSVAMPGIPLRRVRYMGRKYQNAWDFPRLYVDGDSWLWKFAASTLRDWGKS